uniref:Serine/threonine protein kinase n=1 Tax=Tetraselmis sp. GSL018 TaxID=582737 RepID=A0A061SN50_9CHLO
MKSAVFARSKPGVVANGIRSRFSPRKEKIESRLFRFVGDYNAWLSNGFHSRACVALPRDSLHSCARHSEKDLDVVHPPPVPRDPKDRESGVIIETNILDPKTTHGSVDVRKGPLSLGWSPYDRKRYLAQSLLGIGGYGRVYLAIDEDKQVPVAIKVIPKVCPDGSDFEKVRCRLVQEANMLRQLQESPHVVRLQDQLEDDKNAYLVMEYLQGETLEEFVVRHRESLTEIDIGEIALQVFSVLYECHRQGIVYADVKPTNFIAARTASGGIHLTAIDFGCAQQVSAGKVLCARRGTYKYFAPEVYLRHYSTPADVWSAGMMLYRLVAGKFPWWSKDLEISVEEAQEKICSPKPVPFHGKRLAQLSPQARDFLQQALTKDQFDRPTAYAALQHQWLVAVQCLSDGLV